MDEMTLTLNSPITEEQWDVITDVDFEHTNEIMFHTKHGKEVRFVKEQRWIPETEKLPEYGVEVLAHDEFGDFSINHVIDEETGDWFFDGVVAWMPLPKPYKEGEDD